RELLSVPLDGREHDLVELGCNHEQQHQELIVMDAKHLLSRHAFDPVYASRPEEPDVPAAAQNWRYVDGGAVEVGHDGSGFAFDNEGPRHQVLLEPFEIAGRAVTNADWMAFIDDEG